MSWMKRRGQPSPNPTNSGVPMYNPNSHSNPQQPYQQWQQPQFQQQYNNDWYNQTNGANKTPPIQQYPQPQTNNYWSQQQSLNQPHSNLHQSLPNHYQNYNQLSTNQQQSSNYYQPGYQQDNNIQQNFATQNYYTNQQGFPKQINSPATVNQVPAQSTEQDPWNWDWDDNTNANSQQQKELVAQNTLTDSFANDESWNWSVDDSNNQIQNSDSLSGKVEEHPILQPNNLLQHQELQQQQQQQQLQPVKTDTLEDLPVIRRIKNDNLTPQWSIESQVSQDSSEDVLLTSESDNRSNILSQSSTTSQSPSCSTSMHDHGADFVTQYKYDHENIQQQPIEQMKGNQINNFTEQVNSDFYQNKSQICVDNVDKALQELSLSTQVENKEIVTPENTLKEEMSLPLKEPTPPPHHQIKTPPLQPSASNGSNLNPHKKTINLTLKSSNTFIADKHSTQKNSNQSPLVFLQHNNPTTFTPQPLMNLHSVDNNLGVNLETLPDNSERPDQFLVDSVPLKPVRKSNSVQSWPENYEIAPINDRNQYLETGQLSDADVYNQTENTLSTSGDNNDSLPPPGLRRLVLGQMEQPEINQAVDNNLDEPPPGLSRMVLGSTAFEPTIRTVPSRFQPPDDQNNEEPPAGLHRMIPGESSPPESTSYLYPSDSISSNFNNVENYGSESELNQMGMNIVTQRSATIGADTPPVTNQQTISSVYSNSSSVEQIPSREGAVGIDSELTTDLISGSNNTDEDVSDNRRKDIEGGPQDQKLALPRDQTVGQNTTDIASSSLSQPEKQRTRNYTTTDSDHEQSKERHNRSTSPSGRYDKVDRDRRYYDERRERHRDRDSPERYRNDRKYEKQRHKERRYEDETDYFSDKERNDRRHRDDREEYDRHYNSLRRNKERGDRRDRRDYERDERRHDYYYQNRYDSEYYNRSRPSSRSDSMHDAYREKRDHDRSRHRDLDRDRHRDYDRERDHRRRTRDPFNSYYSNYNFDPYNNAFYQQYQYQYFENLRRTNPQAYAEWYRKYYQQGGAVPLSGGYNTEDRASVHSGRSSANEELNKDRYTRQSYYSQQSLSHYYRESQNASTIYTIDDSRIMDQTDASLMMEDTNIVSQRLTPAKFSTAHIRASISSGRLINIFPHYPLDGQPAILEIISIQSLLFNDDDQKELSEFPGPLVKGVTHKKTVIEYCENKIKKAYNSNVQDVESYILLWELLILLLRQNGMVVGTDIAELLMKNKSIESSRRPSVSSSSSTQHIDNLIESVEHNVRVSPAMQYKEEFVTDKFREYLIYGSEKEALEWAMKHGLWGHALFLASNLDKRTYANVMMRFANGLTMNDPLQTLYQLLSGRQPAAVTSVADEKWGDWRPHLAMILSNTTQRPELDRKAIITMGDTLLQRGSLYAAHFCYLMSQVEFGRYNSPNVKLVLLSSSHQKPFKKFASNEAIFMTEIYEYACSLNATTYTIPEFQSYKYIMATRMVDHGLLEKGLSYLERVAIYIKENPSRVQPILTARVCELADKLKYCDPIQEESDIDSSKVEQNWLSDLKNVLNDINTGIISQENKTLYNEIENQQLPQIHQQSQQMDYYQQQQLQIQQNVQHTWQQVNETPIIDYSQQQNEIQQPSHDSLVYQDPHWNKQQDQQSWEQNQSDLNNQQAIEEQQQNEYWNTARMEQPKESPKKIETDDVPRPQISMPNQTVKSKNYFDEEENVNKSNINAAPAAKTKSVTAESKQTSTGWLGGILSKLSLKPKNQMKLPDDKNPTIVWDSEKKRWVNLEEDDGNVNQNLKPPPKMSEMFPTNKITSGPQSLPAQINNHPMTHSSTESAPLRDDIPQASSVTQPNMFKLQRGRNLKKAYVDVFNPGSAKSESNSVPAPEVFASTGHPGGQMNYFVPKTVTDPNAPTDFLTPPTTAKEENSQLSRWSSTSSLSREVQFYMQRPKKSKGGAPMMYNPNQFSN